MSLLEDYRFVKGKSCKSIIISSLVWILAIGILFFFTYKNADFNDYNVIALGFCIGLLGSLDKGFKQKKKKNIDYKIFRNFYITEYVLTFVCFMLMTLVFVLIAYVKKLIPDLQPVQIAFRIESDLLMFAWIPFLGVFCGKKYSFPVTVLAATIYSLVIAFVHLPIVAVNVIFAVAIPVFFISSNYVFLKNLKNRFNLNNYANGDVLEYQSTIIRDYKIYTGSDYSAYLLRYGIMVAALSVLPLIFAGLNDFDVTNASIMTSIIIVSITGFNAAKCNPSELYKNRNCYFLSVKNTFKIYRNYYLLSYGTLLTALMLYVILSYIFLGLNHTLPDFFGLKLMMDIENLLLVFAIVPFFFGSKSYGVMIVKIFIIVLVLVPVKIFLEKSTAGLPVGIAVFVVIPLLMYLSNKKWLMKAEKLYLDL